MSSREQLFHNLLRKGHFPENLPPPFTSKAIASQLIHLRSDSYISTSRAPFRAATYSRSKRGLSRRVFSVVHPYTSHDLAKFVSDYWCELSEHFSKSTGSYSVPSYDPHSSRAITINSHAALERARISRLSSYRFIVYTDIAQFYPSIYTHSIPWAYHGREKAKCDRDPDSIDVFCNKADSVIRNGQDGQTIGIPVGPDASRVFSEVIGAAIDVQFNARVKDSGLHVAFLRHVDDVWIGTHSRADAETALSYYREAVREYELDINELKTKIFAAEFSFVNWWTTEISNNIESAVSAPKHRVKDRLRSALEYAFSMAVERRDDGILKYTLRNIDQGGLSREHWDVIDPYLKRVAVHYGHTIDYVTRILAWRKLTIDDLNVTDWLPIMGGILDKHGRLGNDEEVCWTIYAYQMLGQKIQRNTAQQIVKTCGALSITALLSSVQMGLLDRELFDDAKRRIDLDTDPRRWWPLFLEWRTREWDGYNEITSTYESVMALNNVQAYVYDTDILPRVFQDVDPENFFDVLTAIEFHGSAYQDTDEHEENGEEASVTLPF